MTDNRRLICHDWISEEFEESTVNVEKFFWHKKLHGLADSHFGFTPLNTSGCLFLFCAYFLWSRFAAWIWFHATLAEKILSFLSLARITPRKHSPRLAGIAKIFSTRIMRTSHTSILLQRSQLCTSGSKSECYGNYLQFRVRGYFGQRYHCQFDTPPPIGLYAQMIGKRNRSKPREQLRLFKKSSSQRANWRKETKYFMRLGLFKEFCVLPLCCAWAASLALTAGSVASCTDSFDRKNGRRYKTR